MTNGSSKSTKATNFSGGVASTWRNCIFDFRFLCVCPHRVVLEDLAHGPRPVCGAVRRHDPGQHIPGRVRLQERQVCTQTQVRIMNRAAQSIILTK